MLLAPSVALVYGKNDDYDYKQTTLPLVVSLPRSTRKRRGPWRGFLLNWSLFHSLAWVLLLCSSPLGISCVRRRTEGGVLEGRSSSWGLLPATWHTPYSTNIYRQALPRWFRRSFKRHRNWSFLTVFGDRYRLLPKLFLIAYRTLPSRKKITFVSKLDLEFEKN